MDKKKYERTEMDIIKFSVPDIITTSLPKEEDNELPIRV